MAKKKRRHRKSINRHKKCNFSVKDRHHLCWTKRKWERGIWLRLRLHPYCIVMLPRNTLHKYIHKYIRYIPLPSEKSVQFALEHLELLEESGGIRMDDPVEKRLKVLIALFDYTDQETADAFRKQLAIVCEYNGGSLK